jgi:hypothetical protein
MYKKVFAACAGFAVLVMVSGMAYAGVPCAGTTSVSATGNSVCAPGAAICPLGDMDIVTVTVVVRDCYGGPLQNQIVTVEAWPTDCPECFCFCPGEDSKVVGPTDATGTTTATFRYFGGCGELYFYATVGGITAGPSPAIYIASPDNNADCIVDLIDFGTFAQHYLSANPCSDYNCDGIVDLIDFGTFAQHYLHTCP